MAESTEETARPAKKRKWKRTKRGLLGMMFFIILYPLYVLIGLIPLNNDFQPSPNGVPIYIVSNPVHADLVLPLVTETIDWRKHFPAECFEGNGAWATHVAIGWGDKGFFIETPTWDDLKASTAVHALFWPSDTCLHVSLTTDEYLGEDSRRVQISQAQYAEMVSFIEASFEKDEHGQSIQIPGAAYNENDAFFEATGTYFCTNTCNSWIGRAMHRAEIRAPLFAPLPKTVFLYLPEEQPLETDSENPVAD